MSTHNWQKREDDERAGERWTCLRCGLELGPKTTSVKKVRAVLLFEKCPKGES